MVTASLYENDTDRKLHSSAIHMLARQFNLPEKDIQVLYETMLSRLKERSRIKDFLVVLVIRNVKDMIRRS